MFLCEPEKTFIMHYCSCGFVKVLVQNGIVVYLFGRFGMHLFSSTSVGTESNKNSTISSTTSYNRIFFWPSHLSPINQRGVYLED